MKGRLIGRMKNAIVAQCIILLNGKYRITASLNAYAPGNRKSFFIVYIHEAQFSPRVYAEIIGTVHAAAVKPFVHSGKRNGLVEVDIGWINGYAGKSI